MLIAVERNTNEDYNFAAKTTSTEKEKKKGLVKIRIGKSKSET